MKNSRAMDRIYNNEALVGCVILMLLKDCGMDIARLSVVVPLLVNDKIRSRLSRHREESLSNNIRSCYAILTLNRIYQEMLVIEINSLVMLSQADLVLIEKEIITLTDKGTDLVKNMRQVTSLRLKEIMKAQSVIMRHVNKLTTEQLYKAMEIQL